MISYALFESLSSSLLNFYEYLVVFCGRLAAVETFAASSAGEAAFRIRAYPRRAICEYCCFLHTLAAQPGQNWIVAVVI